MKKQTIFSAVVNGEFRGFFVSENGEFLSVSEFYGSYEKDQLAAWTWDNGLVKSRFRIPREQRTNSCWDSSVVGQGFFVPAYVTETGIHAVTRGVEHIPGTEGFWTITCPETGETRTTHFTHAIS